MTPFASYLLLLLSAFEAFVSACRLKNLLLSFLCILLARLLLLDNSLAIPIKSSFDALSLIFIRSLSACLTLLSFCWVSLPSLFMVLKFSLFTLGAKGRLPLYILSCIWVGISMSMLSSSARSATEFALGCAPPLFICFCCKLLY